MRGGVKVDDGSVRELGATTWPELVERILNHPRQINITKDEFHALPDDQQKVVKSTAFMTAVSFKDYSGPRRDANAYRLELAILDIDTGELAQQIWSDPSVLSAQLGELNHAVYRTASHTDKNPRLRLVVDVEPMELDRHPHVIAHIAGLLGVTSKWSGFRESTVLSQPMFLPCMFRGETTHPIVTTRTNGRALTAAEVPDAAPDCPVKKFSAETFDSEESIEFMPLNVSMAEVKEALFSIDADCSYKMWYENAAALRHQFRTEEEAEIAYELWDEWSQKAQTKYPADGEEATYAKWKSFRPYRPGSPPITIRTLFHHAIAAGWRIAPTLDRLMAEFNKWVDEQNSATDLIGGFAARLKSLPALSVIIKKTLCSRVLKRYNKLSDTTMTISNIMEQLNEDNKRAQKEIAKQPDMPAWLRPFVYLAEKSLFINTTTMAEYSAESFHFTFGSYLLDDDARDDGVSRPKATAPDFACHLMQIPKVYARIYDPRFAGSEPIFTHNAISYLNTYLASYPEPDPTTSELAGKIMICHLEKLIEEPENRLHLLDWMAHHVQKPGVKIRHAVLIQSVQGAGKGLMLEAMKGALGPTNVKSVSNNIVASQWSDWMMGAQLICIEELHVQGQSRKAIMNGIKEFLTNDRIPINKRNTTAFEIDNVCNCIMFTNEESAAAIDAGERRYFVLKSPLRTREQVEALAASGHFAQLARLGDPKDLAPGFRHFLLHYPIRPSFDANGVAPATKYMDEMVEDSEPAGITAIKNLIDDEDQPYITKEFISIRCLTTALGNNFARPSHYLRDMGFEKRLERVRCGTKHPTDVWGPRGSSVEDIKAAVEQVTNNEKTTEL